MQTVTKILLWLNFQFIGQDKFGNKYYESYKVNQSLGRKTRSVMYQGMAETSKVPPRWHAWLHYLSDEIPYDNKLQYGWQKEYLPNLTGTKYAYRPKGHMTLGGIRSPVASDYQAWRP
jgi:NADH:ubiquinone oxidoreductase subunit